MNLEQLKSIMRNHGATKILYKQLAENDNSKNQIYLGGSYEAIQVLPFSDITVHAEAKLPNYKASLNFYWIDEQGNCERANDAKLILYPKYPEVRLSGMLKGCSIAPSKYLQPPKISNRKGYKDGRILLLAPVLDKIFAYLAPPNTSISLELSRNNLENVFGEVNLLEKDSKLELIDTLKFLYATNPHELVRLFKDGSIHPYSSRNAAGYTLEAAFGIIPNGIGEPDFKGWELKCFNGSIVTLMTPEPDGGEYANLGTRSFIEKYGRITEEHKQYFTGPYSIYPNLKFGYPRVLAVNGFNTSSGRIENVNGSIQLLQNDIELASWSFSHILSHWNKKHNQACYVKYDKEQQSIDNRKLINYKPKVTLCEHTTPEYFLKAISSGHVYLDPGDRISTDGKVKARNQFRTKEKDLFALYRKHEIIDLNVE